MSRNSKALITANYQELINFISEKFGEIGYNGVKRSIYDGKRSGLLQFSYNGVPYEIFFAEDTQGSFDNVPDGKYSYILTYCSPTYVEILQKIALQFGGYVQNDEYADEGFYPVVANPDGSIKPIIYVTMQDIYKKYDAIVIIKDKI